MKTVKLSAIVLSTVLALGSCSDEQVYMEWDIKTAPDENFEVLYAPEFYNPVNITAGLQAGTVTLVCTNFAEVYFHVDAADNSEYVNSECGFTMSKTDGNTIKITFDEIEKPTDAPYDYIMLWGKQGKSTQSSTIAIRREALD